MIPEELEKRVQEAKKEVRGQGEGGRGNVRVSGHEGEHAGQRPGPPHPTPLGCHRALVWSIVSYLQMFCGVL